MSYIIQRPSLRKNLLFINILFGSTKSKYYETIITNKTRKEVIEYLRNEAQKNKKEYELERMQK